MTLRELSEKDVIQLETGQNLGRVDDLEFDGAAARVQGVVLRGRAHLFGLLGSDEDLHIPWRAIQSIGADVILVSTPPDEAPQRQKT